MNPERINIKDLTIEEPEKEQEVFFDPEKDITEVDWENIKKHLEKERSEEEMFAGGWQYFIAHVGELKILDPTFDAKVTKKEWGEITKQLEKERRHSSIAANELSFSVMARAIKIINPTYDLRIKQEHWERMRKLLEKYASRGIWSGFFELAANMKVLDPSIKIDIDELDWDAIQKNWRGPESYSVNGTFNFPELAANIRILDPTKLELTQTDWENMNNQLERGRHKEVGVYTGHQAAIMKILAAERVEATDKGLEITMPARPESLGSEVPGVPEQRNF